MNVVFKPQAVSVNISAGGLAVGTGTPIARDYVERDPYEGEYTITPSTETQVLNTRNLRMTDNVTVEPIPQNYGLITWNGSTLTVS